MWLEPGTDGRGRLYLVRLESLDESATLMALRDLATSLAAVLVAVGCNLGLVLNAVVVCLCPLGDAHLNVHGRHTFAATAGAGLQPFRDPTDPAEDG